jgi:hypothetical protein
MKRIFIRLVLGFIVLCILVAYANFGGVYLFPWTINSLSNKASNDDKVAFDKLEQYYRFFPQSQNNIIDFYREYKDKYGTCSPLIHHLLNRNAIGDKEEAEEIAKNCEGYRK